MKTSTKTNLITRSISCHRYPSQELDDPTIRLIRYVAHDVTKYRISASISPVNSGRVSGVGIYPLNSTVSLTAVPNSGYDFVRWSDNVTMNPRTVTVTGNASYSAIFELDDDPFLYDLKLPTPDSGELDFLYTADIHVGWKNFGSNRWGRQVFSLDTDQTTGKSLVGGDVKAYQNKLKAAGIPTYLLDCGDWSKSNNYNHSPEMSESQCVNRAIEIMRGMDYFGITTGNWEFKWNPISTAIGYLNGMVPYGLMACNINDANGKPLYPGGINSEFPGCKTIRVGGKNGKRIAVIAVGYPSPNGFETYGNYDDGGNVEYNSGTYRWNYKENDSTKYRFYDSADDASMQQNRQVSHSASGSLYGRLQAYIDKLKNTYGFNYVIVFSHMDKYSDEDYSEDDRFFSRADFTIMNTSGIDVLIPGHLNSPVSNTYPYKWKNNKGTGIIAPEAGGEMNSFGRLRINVKNNTITCNLITSWADLTV